MLKDWSTKLSSKHFEAIDKAYQEAINCSEQSQSNPDLLSLIYQNRGYFLWRQGQLGEGIACCQKAIYHNLQRSKPEFVKQYWHIGKLQEPNFLIIGVAKCGTTALYDYMVQHPQILPSMQHRQGQGAARSIKHCTTGISSTPSPQCKFSGRINLPETRSFSLCLWR